MSLADTDTLLAMFSDPIVMAHYSSTRDRAGTIEWIRRNERSYQQDGFGIWIVEDRTTGNFLGQCGLLMQTVDQQRLPEVGYMFQRSAWGHGYATEAVLACLHLGFMHYQFPQIIALIAPANQPSRRVAERCGLHLDRTTIWHDRPITVYSKALEPQASTT